MFVLYIFSDCSSPSDQNFTPVWATPFTPLHIFKASVLALPPPTGLASYSSFFATALPLEGQRKCLLFSNGKLKDFI